MYKFALSFIIIILVGLTLLPVVVNAEEDGAEVEIEPTAEEFWLNEIRYFKDQLTSVIEIVLRPNITDFETYERDLVYVDISYIGRSKDTYYQSMRVTVSPPSDEPATESQWDGNWHGQQTTSTPFFDQVFHATGTGGLKMTSALSGTTKYYCWGASAAEGENMFEGDDDAKCDVVVSQDLKDSDNSFAKFDKTTPVEGGGAKGEDFEFGRYVDLATNLLSSFGRPNSCTAVDSNTCADVIKQTLKPFAKVELPTSSGAVGLKSFAVVMGVVLLSLGVL